MASFICYAKGIEQYNFKGESMGIGSDRALYFSKSLGKHRVYRSTYPTPPLNPANDFKLLSFKSQQEAQDLCDVINEAHTDRFTPLEIN